MTDAEEYLRIYVRRLGVFNIISGIEQMLEFLLVYWRTWFDFRFVEYGQLVTNRYYLSSYFKCVLHVSFLISPCPQYAPDLDCKRGRFNVSVYERDTV